MAAYVVGLTGGIGSGKTAASDCFDALGIVVVDADVEARRVVEPGSAALDAITARFGDQVLAADGSLDRLRLRERVFNDPAARAWLEQLLHPLVNQRMADQLRAARSAYAVLVNPLMRGRDPRANRVLVIDVPEAVQVRRTMARDGVDEAGARAVLAAQIARAERLAFADDVITNDGTLAALRAAVGSLHERYLRLAAAAGEKGGVGASSSSGTAPPARARGQER